MDLTFVPISLFGVYVAEAMLTSAAPRLLATLALFPLGKARSIPLPSSAARALTQEGIDDWGYRTARIPRAEIARLPGARVVEPPVGTLLFLPERGQVLAHTRVKLGSKGRRSIVLSPTSRRSL